MEKTMLAPQFTITQTQALLKLSDDQCKAFHNWIASAVESNSKDYGGSGKDSTTYSKELVAGLRKQEEISKQLRRVLLDAGQSPCA